MGFMNMVHQSVCHTGRFRFLAAVVGTGLLGAPAVAGDPVGVIRVLTLESFRAYDCNGAWDTDLVNGEVFEDLRAALTDPANFGIGGVVDREIQFNSVPEINGPLLSQTDIVMLSTLSEPLTACELRDLGAFVEAGGGLFVFENSAGLRYGPLFGAVGTSSGDSSFGAFASHATTVGPFANTAGSSIQIAFHRHFESLGAHGAPILNHGESAVAAGFEHGLGRAVLFCDEEWVASFGGANCGAGAFDLPLALSFFMNAVAWITPEAGFEYEPVVWPPCPADLVEDCVLDFFDVQTFLARFSEGDLTVDFIDDGVLDFFDVLEFLNDFAGGC